jgi:hypothetical protein
MALDLTPDAWFATWSEDGTNITVPIASFTGLTATEADTTTGDIREVMLALLQTLYTVYTGLPTADKPTKMTVSRSEVTTGSAIQRKYTVTFTADSDQFVIDGE